MYTKNNNGPEFDPCGTLLTICLTVAQSVEEIRYSRVFILFMDETMLFGIACITRYHCTLSRVCNYQKEIALFKEGSC